MPGQYEPIYPGNWDQLNEYIAELTSNQDIDTILAGVSHVEWRPMTLLNGCRNYGQGYAPARYRVLLNNSVFLEGRLGRSPAFRQADAPIVIAKLASDALPGPIISYAVPTDTERVARIEIRQNQDIAEVTFVGFLGNPAGAEAITLSLDQISYSVGASAT